MLISLKGGVAVMLWTAWIKVETGRFAGFRTKDYRYDDPCMS